MHSMAPIIMTSQGTNTPSFANLPDKLGLQYFPLNAGTISGLIYATLYVLLEPVAGGILAPVILAATALGNYSTTTYGATANYWAAGIHIVSWIAQFVGHGVYEGRAPALLDNLVQAIFLAPLFVWLEALFAFGYRPELKARLDKGVQEDIAKFKSTNGHAK
ncbi:MAG: hypothetical protein Q9160_005822 [Pyrenula sp. 1 TL-2023]